MESHLNNSKLSTIAEHLGIQALTAVKAPVAIDKQTGLLVVKGHTIGVRGASLGASGYRFNTSIATDPEYMMFMCFAPDYEYSHFYLIPSSELVDKGQIYFSDSKRSLAKYGQYRDNLNPVLQ